MRTRSLKNHERGLKMRSCLGLKGVVGPPLQHPGADEHGVPFLAVVERDADFGAQDRRTPGGPQLPDPIALLDAQVGVGQPAQAVLTPSPADQKNRRGITVAGLSRRSPGQAGVSPCRPVANPWLRHPVCIE